MDRSLDSRLFHLVIAALVLASIWHNAPRLIDAHSPLHRIAETNEACLGVIADTLEAADRPHPGAAPQTLQEC